MYPEGLRTYGTVYGEQTKAYGGRTNVRPTSVVRTCLAGVYVWCGKWAPRTRGEVM